MTAAAGWPRTEHIRFLPVPAIFSVSALFMPAFSLPICAGTVIYNIFICLITLPSMCPGWLPVAA